MVGVPMLRVGLCLLLASGAAAGPTGCPSTSTVSSEEWDVALSALENMAAAGGVPEWSQFSKAWLPFGQRVHAGLEENLVVCPEGAVLILLMSMQAMDAESGNAVSLELVKMLHHLLSGGGLPLSTGPEAGAWQRHWLLGAASMLRFTYLKWVNVPQDAKDASTEVRVAPANPALRSYHAFLFKQTADEFLRSGAYDMELTENSVLFSEAFAFLSFCRMYEVTTIVESGVYKGVSTELWSLFAKQVIAVDIFVPPEAEERLARRPNVQLHTGDGRTLLPALLKERPSERVGVFIDGPKGELAIHLALSLRTIPQVAFVAMHDMEPYREELIKLGAFFFSDESWFQEAYGHFDAPFHARPDLPAGGTMAFLRAP